MMQVKVPLQSIPNQTTQITLGNQPCILNVYQLAYGLFVDVLVGNSYVAAAQIALNQNRIVRASYSGFVGDLAFFDIQGQNDPDYTGVGTRYFLIYDDTGFAAYLR